MEGKKIYYIYKNLMREMRMYFFKQFHKFVDVNDYHLKNLTAKLALFPLRIREFVNTTFDQTVRLNYLSKLPAGAEGIGEYNLNNEVQVFDNKELYFTFACLIMPKQMLRLIELDSDKITQVLTAERRQSCSLSRQIEKFSHSDCLSLQSHDSGKDLEVDDILKYTGNDFLGHLKNKSLDEKKLAIIKIYKFFYGFSFERIYEFLGNPIMMVMI